MFYLTTGFTTVVFQEYRLGAELPKKSGLYVVSRTGLFGFSHLYIGKASDLDARAGSSIGCHEHWTEFLLYGADQVGIALIESDFDRESAERELISYLCPPLNRQHNALSNFLAIPRLPPKPRA